MKDRTAEEEARDQIVYDASRARCIDGNYRNLGDKATIMNLLAMIVLELRKFVPKEEGK